MVIRDGPKSNYVWCKVLYVAVNLCLLDLSFPFENHYEVHGRYMLSSKGEELVATLDETHTDYMFLEYELTMARDLYSIGEH